MPTKRDDAPVAGRAMYEEKILPLLKSDDRGKVVVIDVNSGDYEIDSDDAAALFRLLERRPDAFTWTERVGYPVAHRMGFGFARQAGELTRD